MKELMISKLVPQGQPSVIHSSVSNVLLFFPHSLNHINPYLAKLIYLNFQPLEVVSRYRDPQP